MTVTKGLQKYLDGGLKQGVGGSHPLFNIVEKECIGREERVLTVAEGRMGSGKRCSISQSRKIYSRGEKKKHTRSKIQCLILSNWGGCCFLCLGGVLGGGGGVGGGFVGGGGGVGVVVFLVFIGGGGGFGGGGGGLFVWGVVGGVILGEKAHGHDRNLECGETQRGPTRRSPGEGNGSETNEIGPHLLKKNLYGIKKPCYRRKRCTRGGAVTDYSKRKKEILGPKGFEGFEKGRPKAKAGESRGERELFKAGGGHEKKKVPVLREAGFYKNDLGGIGKKAKQGREGEPISL